MNSKKMMVLGMVLATAAFFGIARAEEHEHEHGHGGEHHKKSNIDVSKLPPASTQQGVTYDKDIKPILEDYCTDCHGEDKQKAKLRLDSLAAIMKGGEEGKVVVPGKSEKSQLVISVARLDAESAMPPNRKPGKDVGPDGKKLPPVRHVSNEQIGLIRAWIDQGAK